MIFNNDRQLFRDPPIVMLTVTENDLNPFINCSRILISGFSHSGKSNFVSDLVNKYHKTFEKIIVLGSILENIQSGIQIIYDNDYNPFTEHEFDDGEKPQAKLIIFDDLIGDRDKTALASKCFYKGRHLNISTIFISHNLFYPDPNYRMISLNSTHCVLFKCRDIGQIERFARTILSKEKVVPFLSLYKKEVTNRPFGYIFIDILKDIDSPFFLRTDILLENQRLFQL